MEGGAHAVYTPQEYPQLKEANAPAGIGFMGQTLCNAGNGLNARVADGLNRLGQAGQVVHHTVGAAHQHLGDRLSGNLQAAKDLHHQLHPHVPVSTATQTISFDPS